VSDRESPSPVSLGDGPPPASAEPRRVQILALTGGGFRGLFTARLLERIEADGVPFGACVNLFAGTSIGALVAGALAVGVPASTVRERMQAHGPAIFPERSWLAGRTPLALRGLFAAPYHPEPLAEAIDAVLGDRAGITLSEIHTPLVIPCMSYTRAGARLLRSAGLAGRDADEITLKEAMLASAAAPTYFPPRLVRGEVLVDGAIVANAPEAVATLELLAHGRHPLDRIHALGIGTASASQARPPAEFGEPGKLGWAARSLVTVAMAAQEDLAVRQCRALLGERYRRLDAKPSPYQGAAIALDRADATASATLLDLADTLHSRLAREDDGAWLRRFMLHRVESTHAT